MAPTPTAGNPFPLKVELHLHLDGAIRPKTILDTAKRKCLKGIMEMSEDEITDAICLRRGCGLDKTLDIFKFFLPIIRSDRKAIVQIVYDLCEDKAKENVCYAEVRFAPHELSGNVLGNEPGEKLTPSDIVQLVADALKKGSKDFNIQTNIILCCISNQPGTAQEVLELCHKYRSEGVVGIDIAGPELSYMSDPNKTLVKVFQEAYRDGVHRTIHAGEVGPASNVDEAITHLHAERVGHAYHVVADPELYERIKSKQIHLETCPVSSQKTGAFQGDLRDHPIKRFADDGANFSINTDDPSVFETTLSKDYQVGREIGLTNEQIIKSIFNAARSSFAPEEQRKEIVRDLTACYGPY